MSDSEGNTDPLSDWTVMVKRGDEITEADVESSDSSIEVVSIEGQEAVSFRYRLDEIPSPSDEHEEETTTMIPAPNEVFPLDDQVVETDGGFGACCMELVMKSVADRDIDEQRGPYEEAPVPVHGDESCISTFTCPDTDDKGDNDSGEESDFVCLDASNEEELNALNNNHEEPIPRVVMMERSTSSIGPSFNFFRPEDPQRHPEDDLSDRDSNAYLDDDTESSVEDAVDDRIESEQSDVGSVQAQNDVGDLSAFADIGDLPLEVGNVARNYIHRPNNRLSTLLNTTVVLAAILTMGMSLGIIMAGDLEIEEWQRAYDGQVKKTLEIEALLFKAESTNAAFAEVLTTYAKAEFSSEPVAAFIRHIRTIVNDYKKCKEVDRYGPSQDCQDAILANLQKSSGGLKIIVETEMANTEHEAENTSGYMMPVQDLTANVYGENMDYTETQAHKILDLDVQQLQQSLTQEQERSLRWQQRYLYERRQRERERENEELEDQRERELWEKEDEEEDRRLRKQWEMEEEEEDRVQRLKWEKEEEEEDRKDRERWERERAQITFDECFKVISANLTGMAQNVFKWNTTSLRDFANLSMLMTSVAKLKHSVVQSVKQLRKSTEVVFAETEKEQGKNEENVNEEGLLFDQKSLEKYLKGALRGLKSEVNSILKINDDGDENIEQERETQTHSGSQDNETGPEDSKNSNREQDNGKWNKAFRNLFKMTSKSLRRFGREIAHTWKNVKSAIKGKKAQHQDAGKEKQFQAFSPEMIKKVCKGLYIPDQVDNLASTIVDVGCQCAQNVRHTWYKNILSNPCQFLGIYSYACNIDHIMLKKDVKQLRKSLEKLIKKDNVKPSVVLSFGYMARKRRLEEFQDFWDVWGDHDLLMKPDKVWARCRLKWWSNFLNDGDPHFDSCRSVDLLALFEGLVEKGALRTFQPKPMDAINTEGPDEKRDVNDKADSIDHNEVVKLQTSDYDTLRKMEKKLTGDKLKKTISDLRNTFNIHERDGGSNHEDNSNDDLKEVEKGKENNHDSIKTFLDNVFTFGQLEYSEREGPVNETFGDLGLSMDKDYDSEQETNEFSKSDWLLERAQHRLQLRRDKEKAAWVFERASQREKLRKQDIEGASDWSYERGRLREVLRKRDHEADWVFDRAKHRREKFKERWMQQPRNKGKNIKKSQGRSAKFNEESSHTNAKFQHHERPQNGGKWQKKWKKGIKNHMHGRKCDKKMCGNKRRGGHFKTFKNKLNNFVRRAFASFSSP